MYVICGVGDEYSMQGEKLDVFSKVIYCRLSHETGIEAYQ